MVTGELCSKIDYVCDAAVLPTLAAEPAMLKLASLNLEAFRKRVTPQYVRDHRTSTVIHKLRTNQVIGLSDLQ
jgi:hypothetical protein